jgi:hypothetical protein
MRKSGLVSALAIIGLVLGVVGLLISFLPCIGWLGILASGPALILAIVALVVASARNAPKNLAIAALCVSVVGVGVPVVELLALSKLTAGGLRRISTPEPDYSKVRGPTLQDFEDAERRMEKKRRDSEKKRKEVTEAALSKYPPPQYPMDLIGWILSPDKTAAMRAGGREVREFKTGKTLRLIAEGGFGPWSPDSKWIVYENTGYCYVSRDGKINRRLTDVARSWETSKPVWQPGSKCTLLFFDGQRYQLYSIDKNKARVIATDAEMPFGNARCRFSPNGRWIVYYGPASFGYLSANDDIHYVYVRSTDFFYAYATFDSLRWSGNCDVASLVIGETLFLLHLPTGRLTPVCGSGRIKWDDRRGYDGIIVLSPDSRRLVFLGRETPQHVVLLDTQEKNLKQFDDSR